MVPVGIAAAVAVLSFVLWQAVRYWHVESAVVRYQRTPSQARVDELTELLKAHAATHGQGTRILKLLLWPKVTTRPAYAAGEPVYVSLESEYWVRFAHLAVRQDVRGEDGRVVDARNRRISLWSTVPDRIRVHPAPQGPGVCRAVIHYDCTATYETTTAAIWRRLFRSACPNALRKWAYTSRFDVPIEVNVVAEEGKSGDAIPDSGPK